MVAAATTSLPERLEASRNYDYRYAWIRDQCYTGLALAAHGPHPMLAGTVRFITERLLADGPGMMPGYTVAGEPIAGERRLRLRGFPGGGAKTGNWVRRQFQLDAFGETLSLLAAAAGHDMLGEEEWRAAEVAASAIEKRWREPDAGIWELDDRRWAHSRLACVSGLRAIAGAASPGAASLMSGGGGGHRLAARWSSLADAIAGSLRDCVHPSGRWQRAPDDERLDAALLLPVIRGGFTGGDPRNAATIEAVRTELAADGFVYRFRHDARPLHEAEGAFLLCGFWMAQVEHAARQPGRGRALVRAEPFGDRARRALHRGVRRAPAAAARKPAAGVRARGDAGVCRDAVAGRASRRRGPVTAGRPVVVSTAQDG